MWIKLTNNSIQIWCNTNFVRRFESNYRGTKLVYTSKDTTSVDQSLDEIMIAMGYTPPPKPPVETHETPDVESEAEFVPGTSVLSYRALAEQALTATGVPLTTDQLVDALAKHRSVNRDSFRTVLHKDFQKVRWNGFDGCWWFNDKPLPTP